MSHFQTRVKNFFAIREISFPVALADMASSLARTVLCAFSATPSSIFPQKILHSCPQPADYTTNILEKHRKMLGILRVAMLSAPANHMATTFMMAAGRIQ